MSQSKITYSDKSNINPITSRQVQATAEDFNEIKEVINDNATDADERIKELEDTNVTNFLELTDVLADSFTDNRGKRVAVDAEEGGLDFFNPDEYIMQFDAEETTNEDPGSGYVRGNSETQSLITSLYISTDEHDSGNIESIINNLKVGALITFKSAGKRESYINFTISSITDNSGWFTIGVSAEEVGENIANDDVVVVKFHNYGVRALSDLEYLSSATVDSNGNVYLPASLAVEDKIYFGYDWTVKTGGLNFGVDGLNEGLSFYDDSGDYPSANIYKDDDRFYIGARDEVSTQGLVIDSTGKVGILTAIPDYALDVGGTGRFTDIIVTGDMTISGQINEVETEIIQSESDYIYLRYNNTVGLADGEYTGIEAVLYDGTNNGQLVFANDGLARVGDVGDLQTLATREDSPIDTGIAYFDDATSKFLTKAETDLNVGYLGGYNSSEFAVLAEDETITGIWSFDYNWSSKTGGLNFGTDAIYNGLSFYSGSDSSAQIYRDSDYFYVGARSGTATNGIIIDSDGKVGIGATPDYKLHVEGGGYFSGAIEATGWSHPTYGLGFYITDANWTKTDGRLLITTTAAESIQTSGGARIAGNLMVGANQAPDYTLDVAGTGYFSGNLTVAGTIVNDDVTANTTARHDAVTTSDSAEIAFTLSTQEISASLVTGSIALSKLSSSVQTSLGLADSSIQSADIISASEQAADLTNSSGAIAINCNSRNNFVATNRVTTSTATTISYSNTTNARFITFKASVTSGDVLTFPSGTISGNDNWNGTTLAWTAPSTGYVTFSIYKTGTEYELIASVPFTA